MKNSKQISDKAKRFNATFYGFIVTNVETGEEKFYKTFGRAYKAGNHMAYNGINTTLCGINDEGTKELYAC